MHAARAEPPEGGRRTRGTSTLEALLARSTLGKADRKPQGEPEAAPGHCQVQIQSEGIKETGYLERMGPGEARPEETWFLMGLFQERVGGEGAGGRHPGNQG